MNEPAASAEAGVRRPRAFAVLPAAGRSTRMGSPKLLLPWGDDGGTVVEQVLAAWRHSRIDVVTIVVHPDDAALAEVCRRAGADTVVAAAPPPDMKASVSIGLKHIAEHHRPADDDLWLTAPADLPLLRSATIDQMVAAAVRSPGVVLRPRHAGRFGHPVVWPWPLREAVENLGENEGLNALFDRVAWQPVEAPADCCAPDLDTPDDYRALRPPHDR